MLEAISNTSPLLYLYRADVIHWLQELFGEVWTPQAVVAEIEEGHRKGYDVPSVKDYDWLKIKEPRITPSEWLSLDLGPGELSAMALALENQDHIVLLDDMLARRTAQAAGLKVWGTLKILLEAKSRGITSEINPIVSRLDKAGLWISHDVRQRVLALAGEA